MKVESHPSRPMGPSREEVLADVKQIIGDHMDIAPETIRQKDHLVNDLGCDSLDVVEITMEVEEHFDITVPDDIGEEAQTAGGVADGVLQLLG